MSEIYELTLKEKVKILERILKVFSKYRPNRGLCYCAVVVVHDNDSVKWFFSYMNSKAINFDFWYDAYGHKCPTGSGGGTFYYWYNEDVDVRIDWLKEQIIELSKFDDEQEE